MKNSHSYSQGRKRNEKTADLPAYPRTDLACEAGPRAKNAPGTVFEEYEKYGLRITDLHVLHEEGERHTGQARGRYTTLYCPVIRYWEEAQIEKAAAVLGALLRDYARAAMAGKPTDHRRRGGAPHGGQNHRHQPYDGGKRRAFAKDRLLQHRRHSSRRNRTDRN